MNEAFTQDELEDRISLWSERINVALAPYDAEMAVRLWLDTLRGIEELINLQFVDWEDEKFDRELYELPVLDLARHMRQFMAVRERILARFGEKFLNRFSNLIVQGSAIASSFAAHGLIQASSGFHTLGTMVGYFQSRRRHVVGLLHLMPNQCRGKTPIQFFDTLNILLPLIELNAAPMIGAQNALMVKLAQRRLGIPEDADAELAMLDTLFLEPERLSIVEMSMSAAGLELLKAKESLSGDRLFSAAELRNDILHMEAAYNEFDLRGTDFATAALLIRRLSREFVDRDYWVQISPQDLNSLMLEVGASRTLTSAVTCNAEDYMTCLSSYAPFVRAGNGYLSTVALLSRFMHSWRARVLERKKRFQIRGGFIFEDQVSLSLQNQGFVVQDIVRIDRQEFDVVTLRNGIIWNVQCKNNFVSLDSVDSDAIAFARYNHGLVRAYEKALVKERNREHLLRKKLAVDRVQHMVISRFPVVTDNPRIVVFSRIESFAGRADAVLAALVGDPAPDWTEPKL